MIYYILFVAFVIFIFYKIFAFNEEDINIEIFDNNKFEQRLLNGEDLMHLRPRKRRRAGSDD